MVTNSNIVSPYEMPVERDAESRTTAVFGQGLDFSSGDILAGNSRFIYDAVKRILDIVAAGLLLIFLAPLMGLIALAVGATSGWPIIFSQKRLTDGCKVFTLYKFRTMRRDAEAKSGAVWASARDPRITPLGRFLRVSRLDELPQLVNVLIGDMSLIGPRPERPEIAAELSKELASFDDRHAVKAGITGLAQIMGGYASTMRGYRRKVALDLIYIRNRSLLLDLKIAIKTIAVILTGSGAR